MQIKKLFYGVRGSSQLYKDAVMWAHMLTEKAKHKAKVLIFWEKYGLRATMDAFSIKRSTLFYWKKQWKENDKRIEALNDKSKAPREKRKRLWPFNVRKEIRRLREKHPNLGSEKIHPLLEEYCKKNNLECPKPRTIANLIKDMGGLRTFPEKISHFGKIKIGRAHV